MQSNIPKLVHSMANALLEITFPDVCMVCERNLYATNRHVCDHCLQEPMQVMDQLEVYGESLLMCPDPVLFQWSAWKFEKNNLLQELLHQLKYGGKPGLGFDMGYYCGKIALQAKEMDLCKLDLLKDPILIPVPLHKRKYRQRGYNQAFEIACGFAKTLNLPTPEKEVITRKTYTRTQTGLNAKQRISNLKSVFFVNESSNLKGKDVIIVDDVFTTGATTFELAHCLANHGVNAMAILTLAEA